MPTPEVIDRVQALHEHIENEPHKALETIRPQLAQIVREPHDATHYDSLSERLAAAYDSVQTEHPTLAAALQATMNALNAVGL